MVIIVLEEYRESADQYLRPLARYMINANPNTLTVLAFLFAALAGIAFAFSEFVLVFWIAGGVFVFLNGLFDALDGKVARLSKRASRRGDFLDHVLDRYADVFIIGGLILTPYCDPVIGLLAIVGIIFASYMGTQAQAVGIKREYKGIMSRVDRIVILGFTPIIQYFLIKFGYDFFKITLLEGSAYMFTVSFSFVEAVMMYLAIAGHITAVQRVYSVWNELGKPADGNGNIKGK